MLSQKEFHFIINKWRKNLGVFTPFNKINQIVSMVYSDSDIKEQEIVSDTSLLAKINKIMTNKQSNTLFFIEHQSPLEVAYTINQEFELNPVLTANNFIYNIHSLINNKDYLSKLKYLSNRLKKGQQHIFILDKNRYDNSKVFTKENTKGYFLNEYELGVWDLPSAEYLRKNKIYSIVFISEDKEIKEDIDDILHTYEKKLKVKRYYLSDI